jgi:hypothetical protein
VEEFHYSISSSARNKLYDSQQTVAPVSEDQSQRAILIKFFYVEKKARALTMGHSQTINCATMLAELKRHLASVLLILLERQLCSDHISVVVRHITMIICQNRQRIPLTEIRVSFVFIERFSGGKWLDFFKTFASQNICD